MTMNRLQFIQMSRGAIAGCLVGCEGCNSSTLRVCGNVYDLLGFPVEGAEITLVTGYALSGDDGLAISATLAGPIKTGSLGEFEILSSNPNKDVGLRVTYEKVLQRTVCCDFT